MFLRINYWIRCLSAVAFLLATGVGITTAEPVAELTDGLLLTTGAVEGGHHGFRGHLSRRRRGPRQAARHCRQGRLAAIQRAGDSPGASGRGVDREPPDEHRGPLARGRVRYHQRDDPPQRRPVHPRGLAHGAGRAGGAHRRQQMGDFDPRVQRPVRKQTPGPDRRAYRLHPSVRRSVLGRPGRVAGGRRADRGDPRPRSDCLGRQRRERRDQHHHQEQLRDPRPVRRGRGRDRGARFRQRPPWVASSAAMARTACTASGSTGTKPTRRAAPSTTSGA